MRSTIILCFLALVVAVVAGPVELDNGPVLISKSQETTKVTLRTEDVAEPNAPCEIGWCVNACYNIGFRPPYIAECLSNGNCRCTQL